MTDGFPRRQHLLTPSFAGLGAGPRVRRFLLSPGSPLYRSANIYSVRFLVLLLLWEVPHA